ncbi:MAG: AMP-binding protein, partial [Woeseiaceae bacterium]|nr:AMP-binding protein [Woeseiaceae bacterium]
MNDNPVLWTPSPGRRESSQMYAFMKGCQFDDYGALYDWSIEEPETFWEAVCDFCDVRFASPAATTLANPKDMMHPGWFEGSTLNYAEHLLRHSGQRAALVFCGEDGSRRELSFDALREQVARAAAGLAAAGVDKGDRVAGYMPNCPETVVAMLAAASIGAIWSSCSPDFGANGVVDRFGQIEPKVLFAANGYHYAGKIIDRKPVIAEIVSRIPSITTTVVVPFIDTAEGSENIANAVAWSDFQRAAGDLQFTAVEFDHPLFIMYSSGTTGVPKCIVHGHGGTLLQHLKEHVLHCDVSADDSVFYFTTCGWMMWNWLVSALATGATVVLFDGSPFFDDGRGLWRMTQQEKLTVFGTSAKYLSALEKAGIRPADEFDL